MLVSTGARVNTSPAGGGAVAAVAAAAGWRGLHPDHPNPGPDVVPGLAPVLLKAYVVNQGGAAVADQQISIVLL